MLRVENSKVQNYEFIQECHKFEVAGESIVCEVNPSKKHGICLHPSIASDCMDSWVDRFTRECPVDGIQATCDEERGYLETGEKFGCIHFQLKI